MQSQNSLNLNNGIFFKLKSSFKKLYKNSNFYEIDGSLEIDEITAKIDSFINV